MAYEPDNARTGFIKELTLPETVLSGQTLEQYRAVKKESGKVSALNTEEGFYGIMAEAVDASSGDTVGGVLERGVFVASEIDFGTGDVEEFRDAARALGIYFVEGH